ncbi:MAG: DUF3300 domain-containing protein [Phycisphaerae bacterium]
MAIDKVFRTTRRGGMAMAVLLLGGAGSMVYAQNFPAYQGYTPYDSQPYTPPPPPVAPALPVYAPPIYGPPVAATPQIVAPLTAPQIDQLVAPIALYPDPLLAQLLPASTYPQQVALAAQWLQYNPNPSEIIIAMQNWDPSIKAMVHYPTVLAYMDANLAWTDALGVAFLNQQAEVMQAIQQLRAQALAAGTLQSTPQQQIISQNGVIWIEPVNPQIIYVPQYNPSIVYSPQPGYYPAPYLTFGIGFAIGNWRNNDCDWRNHWISAGQGWQNNWRRDNRGQWARNVRGNRDNNRRFGPAQSIPQRWTRNPGQPLPALPPNMAQRGALQQYRGWPAAQPMNHPGPGIRPGNNRRQFAPPPAGVFGGNYRSDNNVLRAENRGRQSMQAYQAHQNRSAGNQPEYRASQPQQHTPSAFQGMNSYRQVQPDSQRGRPSTGGRR